MKYFTLIFSFLFIRLAIQAQPCANPFFTDDFSSAAGWTSVGAGNVSVAGGVCNYNNSSDQYYDRIFKSLPQTLSDSCFKLCFKFTISPNLPDEGVGVNLISVCAGTLDPISYDTSQNYATTDQDGLVIMLLSTGAYDENTNDWRIELETKKGSVRYIAPNTIYLDSSISTYYVTFQRQSLSTTEINIYTDPSFSTLYGQAVNSIDPTITGLNTLHSGVTTWGYMSRHFTGTVDDVEICQDCDSVVVSHGIVHNDPEILCPNVFTPNDDGVNDQLVFTNLGYYDAELSVYDRWGKRIYENLHYQNDWTGMNLNTHDEVVNGTYYYVLIVSSNQKEFKGFFEILR